MRAIVDPRVNTSPHGRKRTRRVFGPKPISARSGFGPAAIPAYGEQHRIVWAVPLRPASKRSGASSSGSGRKLPEVQTRTVFLGYWGSGPRSRTRQLYKGQLSYTAYLRARQAETRQQKHVERSGWR